MDLVSSIVMLITSRLAAEPNMKIFPAVWKEILFMVDIGTDSIGLQGRRRAETVGIILFCALMTTVSVELIVRPRPAFVN